MRASGCSARHSPWCDLKRFLPPVLHFFFCVRAIPALLVDLLANMEIRKTIDLLVERAASCSAFAAYAERFDVQDLQINIS